MKNKRALSLLLALCCSMTATAYELDEIKPRTVEPVKTRARDVYGDKVLVEKCIEGTEITVGVYGEDEVRALPIVEIRKPEDCEFYNLDVKYVDPTDIHRIPAQISPENYARAQELACAAHKALGCLGISRSDFIVSEDGPVILETNTIPGMTDTSLYPDEIRHTKDPFVHQFVHAEADGPVPFHYPAGDYGQALTGGRG